MAEKNGSGEARPGASDLSARPVLDEVYGMAKNNGSRA
jgi:hypothetical protein